MKVELKMNDKSVQAEISEGQLKSMVSRNLILKRHYKPIKLSKLRQPKRRLLILLCSLCGIYIQSTVGIKNDWCGT